MEAISILLEESTLQCHALSYDTHLCFGVRYSLLAHGKECVWSYSELWCLQISFILLIVINSWIVLDQLLPYMLRILGLPAFFPLYLYRGTEVDLQNLLGATYGAVFFLGCANLLSSVPVFSIERTVFYRERAAGMFSPMSYSFAVVISEYLMLSCINGNMIIRTFMDLVQAESPVPYLWIRTRKL